MNKQKIVTKNAPAAIGPYSQAIAVGNFIFTAGQIHLKPNGELLTGTVFVNGQPYYSLRNEKFCKPWRTKPPEN